MAGANWSPGSSSKELDDSSPLFICHEYSAMLLYGIRFKVFEGGQAGLLFCEAPITPTVLSTFHPTIWHPHLFFSLLGIRLFYFAILLCVSRGSSGIWCWPYIFCIAKNNLALLTLLSLPTNFWHCRHEPP